MAVDSDSYGHDNPYSFTIHTHGNMAESSRMNQKRKDEEMDDEDGNEGSGGGSGTDNKRKHKFTRSRTACLQVSPSSMFYTPATLSNFQHGKCA